MTAANFTLYKGPIGINDTNKEIIRHSLDGMSMLKKIRNESLTSLDQSDESNFPKDESEVSNGASAENEESLPAKEFKVTPNVHYLYKIRQAQMSIEYAEEKFK